MDSTRVSATGFGHRFEGRNKLTLTKITSQTLQTSPTGSLVARRMNNNNLVPGMSRNEDGIRPTGSILKRVRRLPGKENQCPDLDTTDRNSPNQIKKKVRILSPDGKNQLLTPQVNKFNVQCKKVLAKKLEDDDDFRSPCPAKAFNKHRADPIKVGKDVEHKESSESEVDVPEPCLVKNRRRNKKCYEHWLQIRFQPKVLSDVIKTLSPTQKTWVKATGFGSLLSFKMNEHPQALGYYLAINFKPDITSLCFEQTNIHISDDDVNEVLGLPNGGNNLTFIKNPHIAELWRQQFISPERLGWKITAKMVSDAIRNSTTADRMFKLNFLVLMSNILIEGPKNPYVKQTMLDFAGDIDQCKEYNWCNYLVSHLVKASASWKTDPQTKRYTGSLPFLVYLYMDRVVNGKRQVRRKKPTYIGWSDSLIIERQNTDISKKTLFHGKIALPIRFKNSDDESSYEDNTWNNNDQISSDGEEVECKNRNSVNKQDIICKSVSVPLMCTEVPDSIKMSIPNVSDAQVLWDVVDQLIESMDAFQMIQNKCMMYLLSAKELFRDNLTVISLESKFSDLIKKSTDFVTNNLSGRSNNLSMCTSNSKTSMQEQQLEKNSSSFGGTIKEISDNGLDDGLCLTSQDWNNIDRLSVPRSNPYFSPDAVFNSMQSQSKTLSLYSGRSPHSVKTPGGDSFFKVPLDAMIPSFDLGVSDTTLAGDTTLATSVVRELHVRPTREKRIADVFKSPFIDRLTPVYGKGYKKEETELWDWLHSNDRHPNRILFSWDNITCYKVDFQSMKDGEMILSSVIDVFSVYLNSQEKFRAPTSPRRLFCYIETTLGTLVGYNEKTIEKKSCIFNENMGHILKTYRLYLKEIDMVFFPIHDVNHYYVVCFNLKNPCIDILDNRHEKETDIKKLYGQQLVILKKHMVAYLKLNGYKRFHELELIVPRRLSMYWQTYNNGLDCGIYAMRHMESYHGGGARNWDSKIAPESYTQKNQISRLRLLYTYKMISSNLNKAYELILDEIKDPSLMPEGV